MKTKSLLFPVFLVTMALWFGLCPGRAADSLDPWAERYVGTMVRDVAYGAGRFVAVGDAFYSSSDGVCWTRQALETPSINGLSGVAYGKGRFVAVGSSIATSPDGVEWTNQGAYGGLSAVAFGGESFAAVGEPELILSSTDAVNWTQYSTMVHSFQGITHGNGSFVAVGGYYTGHPRGVAVQSGGKPQACLQAQGFGPSWDPGFRVLLTAEHGRSYRLQSSPVLPGASWTDVGNIVLPPGYPDPVRLNDSTASGSGERFYRVVSP